MNPFLSKTYIAHCVTLEFSDPVLSKEFRVFKIGRAVEPYTRVENLMKDKNSSYFGEKFEIVAICDWNIEGFLHEKYVERRINYKTALELFMFRPDEIDEIIKKYEFKDRGWGLMKDNIKKHLMGIDLSLK